MAPLGLLGNGGPRLIGLPPASDTEDHSHREPMRPSIAVARHDRRQLTAVLDGNPGQLLLQLSSLGSCCYWPGRSRIPSVRSMGKRQAWAGETRDVLREAHTAVAAAKAVTWGQATNRHRDWDGQGNHPGYTLGRFCTVRSYLTGTPWMPPTTI